MQRLSKVRFVVFAALIAVVTGCSKPPTGPVEITDVRPATAEEREVRRTSNTQERMGLRTPQANTSMGGGSASPADHPFAWDVPEGWQEIASTPMRLANFKVSDKGECYFTVLGGDGGGLDANINRWRQQMNVEALSSEEIAALPKVALLNQEATLISIDGAFSGMGGGAGESDYRLLGAALIFMERAFFVKMTGPVAEIADQNDRFVAFCESIRLASPSEDPHAGHDHGPGEHPEEPTGESVAESPGMLPPGHPEISQTVADDAGLPPGHPEIASGGGAVTGPPPGSNAAIVQFDPSAMRWAAPDTWNRAPERMMRNVTYNIDGAECYIAVLPGAAGGVEANINRWVGQMGNSPLPPDAIAALPRIPVLGNESPMVESQGDFTGMSGETKENQTLLGVIATVADQSIFIKMIGPVDVVEAEKNNFIEFCKSLHLEG